MKRRRILEQNHGSILRHGVIPYQVQQYLHRSIGTSGDIHRIGQGTDNWSDISPFWRGVKVYRGYKHICRSESKRDEHIASDKIVLQHWLSALRCYMCNTHPVALPQRTKGLQVADTTWQNLYTQKYGKGQTKSGGGEGDGGGGVAQVLPSVWPIGLSVGFIGTKEPHDITNHWYKEKAFERMLCSTSRQHRRNNNSRRRLCGLPGSSTFHLGHCHKRGPGWTVAPDPYKGEVAHATAARHNSNSVLL